MPRIAGLHFSIIIAACIVAAQTAFAAGSPLDTILSRMEEVEKQVKAVSFSFDQEIEYALTSEKQTMSGTVAYNRPDNFYFRQNKPVEQTIVANGKKVWVYTPSYNQVVLTSWQEWLRTGFAQDALIGFNSNWSKLREKYTFTHVGDRDGCHVLRLSPVQQQDGAQSWTFEVWIDIVKYIPVKSVMKTDAVTVTTVTHDYVVNPALDKKLFNFKIPEATDIIKIP